MSGSLIAERVLADAESLSAPISADAPTGYNPRDDEWYLSVRSEVEKLENPSAGPVDWERVVLVGAYVVRTVAKDLFALLYLAHALQRARGSVGLAVGATALELCLGRYWDALYPSSAKGRGNALHWYVDATRAGLKDAAFGGADRSAVELTRSTLERCERVCAERLAARAPDFSGLLEELSRTVSALPPPVAGSGQVRTVLPPEGTTPTLDSSTPEARETVNPSRSRALAERWLAPIPGPHPAGVDPLATVEFGQIETELDKLQKDPTTFDPPLVIKLGEKILSETGKDLRIACYVTFARFRAGGLDGLARGMALVAELLDEYWQDLSPAATRPRTRAAPIQWLLDRLEQALPLYRPTPVDAVSAELLSEVAKRFMERVGTRLAEHPPAIRPVVEEIERLCRALSPAKGTETPKTDATAEQSVRADDKTGAVVGETRTTNVEAEEGSQAEGARGATEVEPTSKTTAGAGGQLEAKPLVDRPVQTTTTKGDGEAIKKRAEETLGPADVSSPSAADRHLKKIREHLLGTAKAIRAVRRHDPLAYRLLRTAAWMTTPTPIRIPQNGVLGVKDFPQSELDAIASAIAAQKWPDALESAESLLPTNVLVLDLHRMAFEALRGLGPKHEQAAQAIALELRAFLVRSPGLVDAIDNYGHRFADDATKAWIAENVLVGGPPSAAGVQATAETPRTPRVETIPPPVESRATSPTDDAPRGGPLLDALRSTGGRGSNLDAALAWVQAGATPQQRFLRRTEVAEVCSDVREWRSAFALFLGSLRDVREFRLDRWDPSLASRVLGGHLRAASEVQPVGDSVASITLEETLGELARADPSRAVAVAAQVLVAKSPVPTSAR